MVYNSRFDKPASYTRLSARSWLPRHTVDKDEKVRSFFRRVKARRSNKRPEGASSSSASYSIIPDVAGFASTLALMGSGVVDSISSAIGTTRDVAVDLYERLPFPAKAAAAAVSIALVQAGIPYLAAGEAAQIYQTVAAHGGHAAAARAALVHLSGTVAGWAPWMVRKFYQAVRQQAQGHNPYVTPPVALRPADFMDRANWMRHGGDYGDLARRLDIPP